MRIRARAPFALIAALLGCSAAGAPPAGDGPGTGDAGGDAGGPQGSADGGPSGVDDGGMLLGPDGAPLPPKDAGHPADGGGVTPSTSVTILVEPNGNRASELVAAINAATQSVYMTMYEIDDPNVINALTGRKRAGLDVKVVLDGSATNQSFNGGAYSALQAAGVGVVWSSSKFTYTHEKCVMIDGKQAWIMTMNANKSSPAYNREYLAIDTDAADVAEAIAIFQADYAMTPIAPSGNLVVADANARAKLVLLIDSARTSLDVEGEEFSDNYSTGVTNAVARAAQRGVKVRVVLANSTFTPNQTTAVGIVKGAGAKVVVSGATSGGGSAQNPYIHAKAIVVDCGGGGGSCASGFVGSENMTGGSLGYNRELGVIFSNASELAKVEAAIATDFAAGTPQ